MPRPKDHIVLLESISHDDFNILSQPCSLERLFSNAKSIAIALSKKKDVTKDEMEDIGTLLADLIDYSETYARLQANVRDTINWHSENVD